MKLYLSIYMHQLIKSKKSVIMSCNSIIKTGKQTTFVFSTILITFSCCAFSPYRNFKRASYISRQTTTKSDWNSGEDWANSCVDNIVSDFEFLDPIEAIREIEEENRKSIENNDHSIVSSIEDEFVNDVIESLYDQHITEDNPPLYDSPSSFESYTKTVHFEDELGQEIQMLVRCNKEPEDLLISEGRALPELSTQEKYAADQLVSQIENEYQSTDFFSNAVSKIFYYHSKQKKDTPTLMKNDGVAKWMSKSLGEKVGQYEKRVVATIANFGTYRAGGLTLAQFQNIYLDAGKTNSDDFWCIVVVFGY